MQIDMERVTTETVQHLGAQIGMLTLELQAQRAANEALQKRIDELEKPAAEPAAE